MKQSDRLIRMIGIKIFPFWKDTMLTWSHNETKMEPGWSQDGTSVNDIILLQYDCFSRLCCHSVLSRID